MWCVAELNEEYVRKLEDVLEVYERPYNEAEPVVCLDEKPVTLHKDVRSPKPPGAGSGRQARLRVRAVRNRQCVLRGGSYQNQLAVQSQRGAPEFGLQ
jgi:hypothetical protein